MADTASDFQEMLNQQAEQQYVQKAVAQAAPDEKAALAALVKRKEEEELQKKLLLQEQLRAQLQNAPTNIDWTPLAAQLQDMYGGKAPVAAAQSNLAYNKESQERTNKLFDDLTSQKSSGFNLDKALGAKDKNERFDAAQGYKIEKDIRDQKSKIDKNATEIVAGFKTVESAFTPDKDGYLDLKKVMSGLTNYARNIGSEKGALSEGDVDRAAYIKSFSDQFERLKLKFGVNGKIPQSEMQPYLDRLIEAREGQRQRLKSNAEALYNAFANAPSSEKYFQGEDSFGNKIFRDTFKTIDEAGYINPALKPQPKKEAAQARTTKALKKEKTDEELMNMSAEELAAYEAELLGK